MFTVFIEKDSATVVPVAKETLDEVLAFTHGRTDVQRVIDAEGRPVAYLPPEPEPEAVPEPVAVEPVEPVAVEEIVAAPPPAPVAPKRRK